MYSRRNASPGVGRRPPRTRPRARPAVAGPLGAVAPLATDVPVVVLAATPYSSLAIARSLGRLGVAVHGVHPAPRMAASRSRYWRSNAVWDLAAAPAEQSLAWLLHLGQRLGRRPLLLGTDDRSALFLADHAAVLGEAFRLPEQGPGLARALASKQQLYHLCKQHGIPTAETAFPRSREDVVRFAAQATFPVMLKGVDTQALYSRVGARMRRVGDAATLVSLYEQWEDPAAPNLMLQEYVPGGCEQIWMLSAYCGAQGQRLFGMTARKLREYPPYCGVTSLGVCEHNPTVLALCDAFVGAAGYRGILDLDFKYDARSGTYKALDANPRIGANFRLFVDPEGHDVVRACYRDLTGQTVPRSATNEGRKWLVEDLDCVAALRYRRDGGLDASAWARSFRGLQETAWFAADDPLPALARSGRALVELLRQAAPFQRAAAGSPGAGAC